MFPDGICRVTENYYTKTVQFQDINYQLNQNEDKMAMQAGRTHDAKSVFDGIRRDYGI